MPEVQPGALARYTLTSKDAAERLGVSVQTVLNWANQGRLPYLRTPGAHRRFRADDLDAFAASLVQHAHTEPAA